jgi:protein-S-isoprenylcysteine O-methyltransferase Ste14
MSPPTDARSSALDLKLPPLLLAAAVAAAMWALARWLPAVSLGLPVALRIGLAAMLVAAGVGAALAGELAFRRARTTVDPMHPENSRCVVDGGIYRVSRNPMYLGFLLALAGWGLWLGQLTPLLLLPGFVLYLNRFQILPEERALQARFGEAYATYCARARRWI